MALGVVGCWRWEVNLYFDTSNLIMIGELQLKTTLRPYEYLTLG